jgi:hypothetical protein
LTAFRAASCGQPKFASQRRADNYHRVKATSPTNNEADVI